jgi:hypothetical protein
VTCIKVKSADSPLTLSDGLRESFRLSPNVEFRIGTGAEFILNHAFLHNEVRLLHKICCRADFDARQALIPVFR